MLSSSEILERNADGTYGHAKTKEGDRYRYYENMNPKGNQINACLVKKNNGTAIGWWLRLPSKGSCQGGSCIGAGMATGITANGNLLGRSGVDANSINGVAPGFAI